MNPYSFLADAVLVIHFFFFLFCTAGEAAILGAALHARFRRASGRRESAWFRNRRFRLFHLAAVLFVGVEGLIGFLCPLTTWEYELRRAGGQTVESEVPLVPRVLRTLLFHDFPPWVFTALYVGFAVLVLATYFLVRPRRKV